MGIFIGAQLGSRFLKAARMLLPACAEFHRLPHCWRLRGESHVAGLGARIIFMYIELKYLDEPNVVILR